MREIKYRARRLHIDRTEGEWEYFSIWGDIHQHPELLKEKQLQKT